MTHWSPFSSDKPSLVFGIPRHVRELFAANTLVYLDHTKIAEETKADLVKRELLRRKEVPCVTTDGEGPLPGIKIVWEVTQHGKDLLDLYGVGPNRWKAKGRR